jgi:hypothetical protein
VRLYYIKNGTTTAERVLVDDSTYVELVTASHYGEGQLWSFPDESKIPDRTPVPGPTVTTGKTTRRRQTGTTAAQLDFEFRVRTRHEAHGVYCCTFCRRTLDDLRHDSLLQAAHVLERENYTFSTGKSMQLLDVNSTRNGVLLCLSCHIHFDNYFIAVDADGLLCAHPFILANKYLNSALVGAPIDIPIGVSNFPTAVLWKYRHDCYLKERTTDPADKHQECPSCGQEYTNYVSLIKHVEGACVMNPKRRATEAM